MQVEDVTGGAGQIGDTVSSEGGDIVTPSTGRREEAARVGLADEVVAALEAVREKISEARRDMHAGTEKFGDTYGQLKTAFNGAGNPKALAALSQLGQAAERVGEYAVAALATIGEYIQVVRGGGASSGTSASTSTTATGSGSSREVPTPDRPAPRYGRFFDALPVRTKDTDPTDGTLTTSTV